MPFEVVKIILNSQFSKFSKAVGGLESLSEVSRGAFPRFLMWTGRLRFTPVMSNPAFGSCIVEKILRATNWTSSSSVRCLLG